MAQKKNKNIVVAPTRSGAQITPADIIKHSALELSRELKRRRVDARLGLDAGSPQHPKANINIWTGSKPAHFAIEITDAKGYSWSIRGYEHSHQLPLDIATSDIADYVLLCFGRRCTTNHTLNETRIDSPEAGV